jgi:hypothetical protein
MSMQSTLSTTPILVSVTDASILPSAGLGDRQFPVPRAEPALSEAEGYARPTGPTSPLLVRDPNGVKIREIPSPRLETKTA